MQKHFTATVYILAQFGGDWKLLLHKHPHIRAWIGVGGHIEKDENPYEAVIREVKEETELNIDIIPPLENQIKTKDVDQIPEPLMILEEKIHAKGKIPAHIHIDCIYIGICRHPGKIKMEEEFGWFTKSQLKELSLQKEVKVISAIALKSITYNS